MLSIIRAYIGSMGTGYRPDPADPRDLRFGALGLDSTPLPRRVSLRRWIPEILSQGSTSTCVAQTWAQMIRAAEWQRLVRLTPGMLPPPPPLRSRLFAYYHARAEHREQTRDAGTYLRTCAKALTKLGCPPEGVWPWSTWQTINRQPAVRAYRAAFDQRKLAAYYRIDAQGYERVEQVKAALAAGHLVGFGTAIDTDFKQNIGPETMGVPSGTFAGLHAMTICGYDDDLQVFEVANSWGTDYRDRGYFRMTYEWLAWPAVQDLWVGRLAP